MTSTVLDQSQSPAPKGRESLDRLTTLVGDDLKGVNKLIVERMDSPVALIPQLAGHIVAAGGKRMRPLLTLAAARLCGYREGVDHIKLATAVEFIHTATLLHDDVVDESDLRRGRDSANAIWGNKASVLVGDFLFSRAFQLMVETKSIEVLRILSQASAVIAEGEVHQLLTANDTTTTRKAYLEVIEAKTAELFAAAARVGAVVADQSPDVCDHLEAYGRNLGTAFQLTDDVLDYAADAGTMGKAVGDDFRDGKMTLPVILAIERGTDEERGFWKRTLEDQDQHDGDLENAIALIKKYSTLEDSLAEARGYAERARADLEVAPAHEIRDVMAELAAFSVDRAY